MGEMRRYARAGEDIVSEEEIEQEGEGDEHHARHPQRPRQPGSSAAAHPTNPRPCSIVPSVTTPLYSITVSYSSRHPLRSQAVSELRRTPYRRSSENTPSRKVGGIRARGRTRATTPRPCRLLPPYPRSRSSSENSLTSAVF